MGLGPAHPLRVEAVLPERVDVGVQQRRGAGELLIWDDVPFGTKLRDGLADAESVPGHYGVVQDGKAGEGVDLVLKGVAAYRAFLAEK